MSVDDSESLDRIFERLPEIAARGERLNTLREMRIVLATTLTIAPPSNVAALSKEMRELMAEIKLLEDEAPKESSAVDEIAKRRAERRKEA